MYSFEQAAAQAFEQASNDITSQPQDEPAVSVTGETELSISFVFSRSILMLDGKGNVVWSKQEEQTVKGEHIGFGDFKARCG